MKRTFLLYFFCLCIFQVYAQPRIKVLIEGGSKYTNKTTLDVEIFITNIHTIKLGLSKAEIQAETPESVMLNQSKDFSNTRWVPFKSQYIFNIENTNSQQTVYVKVKFLDGTIKIGQASIVLDRLPPKFPSVKIFATADTKTKLLVNLKLSATEAAYVKISNSSSFYSIPWQSFRREISNWQLAPGADGPRKVFVIFKDEVGNESTVVSDLITIDRTKPIGLGLEINNGEVFFKRRDRKLQVRLLSRDAKYFILSQDSTFTDTRWQTFTPRITWTLTGQEGIKRLYVKYKDDNNNQTDVYADSLIFDITAPTGSIKINEGERTTSHFNKIVSLSIETQKDTKLMMISNSSDFAGAKWQLIRKQIDSWQLKGEENEIKVVYIRFKDRAGNVSNTFSDRIMLRKRR